MGCWFIALTLAVVILLGGWYIVQFGGYALVKRDRAQHLAILNAARRRSGKPPLTDADLPPEPDPLAEAGIKLPRGFAITIPPPPPPPPPPMVATPPPVPAHQAGVAAPMGSMAGTLVGSQAIVLLEEGFHAFSQPGLQAVVERAWGVVFPQGEDVAEWVRYAGPPAPAVIACAGYQFLVENAPRPYDLKGGQPVGSAYRSVSIGSNDLSPANAYALLGKLAVELSSGSTVALYLPETGERYAFNPVTRKALGEEDPLRALRVATGAAPVHRSPSERSAAARARLAEVEGKPATHSSTPPLSMPNPLRRPLANLQEELDNIPIARVATPPAVPPSAVAPPAIPLSAISPPAVPPSPRSVPAVPTSPGSPEPAPAPVPERRLERSPASSGAASKEAALSAAMREARRRFPELEAAFRESAIRPEPFLLKSAFSDGVHTEYMWSEIVEITPTRIIGILRSAPMKVTGYREGQDVVIPVEEVADWIAHRETPGGRQTFGNFTGPVLNG